MKNNVYILNHYAGNMLFDKGGRHYWFAKFLSRGGYKPVVFAANSKHGSPEKWIETDKLWVEKNAEEINTPFVFVKARTYMGNGKARVLNMIDFYRNVKRAVKEYVATHEKPDVIYASSVHPLTLVAGIQIAKKFHVKCICEVRDLWPESLTAYGIIRQNGILAAILRKLEKWIYVKSDAIVFTMEGAYDYIIEQKWTKKIPKEKVHFINNGIDLEQFVSNRDMFQIDDEDLHSQDTFKVVYVGSIRKANNLSLLVDAAEHIENKQIKILVWGGGDELEELQQRVEREQIDNIIFKGRVDREYIPYITSKADLNIHHGSDSPILRFGLSANKIFDYLAAGKPILETMHAKYDPVIECGAGMVVQERTPEGMAEAIERFAEMDEAEREQMGNAAAEGAKEYDFSILTEKLVEVIHSIM